MLGMKFIARDPMHRDAILLLGLDAAKVGELQKANEYLARSWILHDVLPIEALLRNVALLNTLEKTGHSEASQLLQDSISEDLLVATAALPTNFSNDVWRSVVQQLVDIGAPDVALQLAIGGVPSSTNQLKGFLLTGIPVLEAAAGGDGQATLNIYKSTQGAHGVALGPRWFEPVPLAQAYSIAAQSMSMLGAKDSAIMLYQASIELSPDDSLVLNNLAWTLIEQEGVTEEVIALCDRAYALDSESSYILDTVGWSYLLRGDIEQSIETSS